MFSLAGPTAGGKGEHASRADWQWMMAGEGRTAGRMKKEPPKGGSKVIDRDASNRVDRATHGQIDRHQ
jgi:hypothetical protein